jgi:hypothetical protein
LSAITAELRLLKRPGMGRIRSVTPGSAGDAQRARAVSGGDVDPPGG